MPPMSEDLDRLAAVIADRVRLRLVAADVATNEPCTAKSADHDHSCVSACGTCTGEGGCQTRALVALGASRVTPLKPKTSQDIAPFIDHTLLKADATREEVLRMCEEAKKHGFATVCLNASNVAIAARALYGSSVKAIAVVGFPLGAMTAQAKGFETREAVRSGAREIDMVVNLGAVKAKDWSTVYCDILAVVNAAKPYPVKVILETSSLNYDEKVACCALSKAAGAAFVKTSTGFGGGGATAEDVALMRRMVGDDMGVKASGGIRSTADALKMIEAGADRLGASASVAIVRGGDAGAGKY